jgi:hypothetical protein
MGGFGPNKHSAFIVTGEMRAFVDGIPDECNHEWNGQGYYFVSYINGGGFDEFIPDTGQATGELQALDEKLRTEGKYLSGGCVSCSKCGKPYEPSMFEDEES